MPCTTVTLATSAAAGVTALMLAWGWFKHSTRPRLSAIRGPESPSFIFGNLLEIYQRPVGEVDFAWPSLYGNVIRFKGIFGGDGLLITDPKALQKILNVSAYDYPQLSGIRVISRTVNGVGVGWAEGEDHKRQRSVMAPGFGVKESRALFPVFKEVAETLSVKWLETIGNSNGQSVISNIRAWLSRGALDAIGQAAFDIQFNTIRDDSHPLAKAYENFLDEVSGLPSAKQIFMQLTWKYIPTWLFRLILEHGSNPRIARARKMKKMATDVAKELIQEKAATLLQGKGNRDILTLLVKANMDADARSRLTGEELISQMRTILLAGLETTANALAWILLELARSPEIQHKLRDEIRKTEAIVQARGDSSLTVADVDAMPYLNVVIKEGLRFHPVAPHIWRTACKDDVLPLSKPVITEAGDMLDEVFVPKGTDILISVAAYNRHKDLWGEDAHEFNPDRWFNPVLNENKSIGIGVYSNLLTFLSGTRACLGWHVAVLEIQAFLFELVGKLEFTMTDQAKRVHGQMAVVMTPVVDGESEQGAQLPLGVSPAPLDE